jgi:hypothetical protein
VPDPCSLALERCKLDYGCGGSLLVMHMIRALGHLLKLSSAGVLLALSLTAMSAKAKPTPSPKVAAQAPFLPNDFAGWEMSGPPRQSGLPQVADAANAGILSECGFRQFEAADYSNQGSKLAIRAIQFQDASGAYCAFTFFRRPGSLPEEIGRTAAWDGSHALFWVGNTLVDATFDRLTAMSTAQLRELASALPRPAGNANTPPSLPGFLPRQDLEAGSTHYALGPDSYSRGGGVLPPALVDFGSGSAEAVTASYSTRDGSGFLTLLEYPTPQLAAARLRAIDAFLKAGNTPQAAWPQALAESHSDTLISRRTGPIVVLISGSFPAATAHKLINQVNYQADVVWNNPQGYIGEASKVARLLLGIFALVAIVGGTAILLGIFFGGGRALIRMLRGKSASSVEETEFIRLKLGE